MVKQTSNYLLRTVLTLFVMIVASVSVFAQESVVLLEDPDIAEGEAGHYYVNMPSSGTRTLTLDGSVKTFKIYDAGGKNISGSDDDGTLEISVSGYTISISAGSANLSSWQT